VGFCGLALVVPVYLGASYAFFNKVFLLIKKKNCCVVDPPDRNHEELQRKRKGFPNRYLNHKITTNKC